MYTIYLIYGKHYTRVGRKLRISATFNCRSSREQEKKAKKRKQMNITKRKCNLQQNSTQLRREQKAIYPYMYVNMYVLL